MAHESAKSTSNENSNLPKISPYWFGIYTIF